MYLTEGNNPEKKIIITIINRNTQSLFSPASLGGRKRAFNRSICNKRKNSIYRWRNKWAHHYIISGNLRIGIIQH